MSIPRYNEDALSDLPEAKARMRKSLNTKYSVPVKESKKAQDRDALASLAGSAEGAMDKMTTLAIQILSNLEEVTPVFTRPLTDGNISKIVGTLGRTIANTRQLAVQLKGIVSLFNTIPQGDITSLQTYLEAIDRILEDDILPLQNLPRYAHPRNATLITLINNLNNIFSKVYGGNNAGDFDMWRPLVAQYNYMQPVQASLVSRLGAMPLPAIAMNAPYNAPAPQGNMGAPAPPDADDGAGGESDDDDLDGAGRSGGFLSAHPFLSDRRRLHGNRKMLEGEYGNPSRWQDL
jgi:hypothetical protein